MKLTITTLVTVNDNQVQDIIHSFFPTKAHIEQDLLDQVNRIYEDPANEQTKFINLYKVKDYFDQIYIETQTITFGNHGTAIETWDQY